MATDKERITALEKKVKFLQALVASLTAPKKVEAPAPKPSTAKDADIKAL